MIRRPPTSTLTDTLFPYTTLFPSHEHREMMAGLANGVEENFLQKPWLTMVIFEGFTNFRQIHRLGRHNSRNGMLIDKLRLSIPPQQDRKIIEPGDDALQFHALDQEHGNRRF